MKLIFVLLALLPILLDLASAAQPTTLVDIYGRVYRNSRMSKNKYQQEDPRDNEDEDDDDQDNDDENDEEQDDDIYPPDFNKLFPNPDNRPVGPDSYDSYVKHHPGNPQSGRPSHGPAASIGPASLRGPIQAQQGQRQGGVGHHSGPRPSHDSPPPRRAYNSGPPPSYQSGPPPNYQSGPPPNYQSGPPPDYHSGPPPSGGPGGPEHHGPPPQYRLEADDIINEVEDDTIIPQGRQLYFPKQRIVAYGNRRVVAYPSNYYGNPYVNHNRYVRYPSRYLMQNRVYTRPRYAHTGFRDDIDDVSSLEDVSPVRGPVVVGSRVGGARIYNPWSISPLRADQYNPQFIFNPTEMRARRRFRYHPSQRIPVQRIPLYAGTWGNPRNNYIHSQTGGRYIGSYFASQF